MALRGNLKDFSLPDVFQLVTFSRKTGVLRIERVDGAHGSVWFRDGDVFFAQSNWHTELLGERLVRAQRLTSQALTRALAMRAEEDEGGRRLGQILIDEGYITDEVLKSFVSEQIQETIFDLMGWDEGDFDFEAMPEAVEEDIGLSVSIENVIMEGSRRLEEWTRIKKKIPSVDVVFKMATAPGEGTFEISLKPMEWNLLLLIDGTRSVAELAHETDRTDFEVARIIYGLFSAGLLEFAMDEEVGRLRAERAEREEKLEVVEAERRAAEKVAEAEAAASQTASAETEPAGPVEVPEFLGGMSAAPTADDAAVLEEMMGAVLQRPVQQPEPEVAMIPEPLAENPSAAPIAPVEPHVPAEDPAFMAVEHVDIADLSMMPVPSVDDLLTDLADLQAPGDIAAADAAATAVAAAWGEAPLVEAEPEPIFEFTFEPSPETSETPVAAVEPSEPEAAAPSDEFVFDLVAEPASQVPPQPESVPEPAADVPALAPEPAEDFERDLMALGLGELPADLFGSDVDDSGPDVAVAPPEPVYEWVEMPQPEAVTSRIPDAQTEVPDFSELLESLDVEPEPAFVEPEALPVPPVIDVAADADFDEELLREDTPVETGGVISTDAFLDDITIDDLDFTGGLTYELSALTGADRPNRPTTNVNRIPEPASGELLHRDSRVGKDTLLKIIDGIKNL